MEMMDLIRNGARLLDPFKALPFEILLILAALAAHDNRMDLDWEEAKDLVPQVPAEINLELVMSEVRAMQHAQDDTIN